MITMPKPSLSRKLRRQDRRLQKAVIKDRKRALRRVEREIKKANRLLGQPILPSSKDSQRNRLRFLEADRSAIINQLEALGIDTGYSLR